MRSLQLLPSKQELKTKRRHHHRSDQYRTGHLQNLLEMYRYRCGRRRGQSGADIGWNGGGGGVSPQRQPQTSLSNSSTTTQPGGTQYINLCWYRSRPYQQIGNQDREARSGREGRPTLYHCPARWNLVSQSVPVSVETVPADRKPGPEGQERERRATEL